MELVTEWLPDGELRKVYTDFQTEYAYNKYPMDSVTLTGDTLIKSKNYYHGTFFHTLESIQQVYVVIRIDILYMEYQLGTKIVAPTIHVLQCLKRCIKLLVTHTKKHILYL